MKRRTFLGGTLAAGAAALNGLPPAAEGAVEPVEPVQLATSKPPSWGIPRGGAPASPYVAPHWGLEKFRDRLPVPPVVRAPRDGRPLTITTEVTKQRLHSQLPSTTMWTYNGSFPGPTIVAQRDVPLNICWRNDLTGTVPLVGVEVGGPTNAEAFASARKPGWRDAAGAPLPHHMPTKGLSDLEPWTVVHVHGANVNGVDDGWSPNGVGPGAAQQCHYPNTQQATTLWYHDHAMDITRFNVHAGLAGVYVVEDAEEQRLGLPSGGHDVPLVINDCNLDTEPSGAPNGQLLYKIGLLGGPTGAPVPMTGPFTMVNGAIWPRMEVGRRLYRFRLLNACVSRILRLKLVDEADPTASMHDAVKIIGTDGGLLDAPQPFPADGLTFTPAERVELLIDFSELDGRRLVLTNWGTTNVEPDIMRFDVSRFSHGPRSAVPAVLSPSYRRLEVGSTVPADHDEAFVALAPAGALNNPHTQLWELGEVTGHEEHLGLNAPAAGRLQVVDPTTGGIRTFVKKAGHFHDATSLFFNHGRWVVWNFLHLGGPVHPTHIHLAQFQEIERRRLDLAGWSLTLGGTTAPLPVVANLPIERHERGWKDTFPVSPGTWSRVAGEFVGGTGSFMYHCHLLDHEDSGMMRPFIVRPASAAVFDLHGSMGH